MIKNLKRIAVLVVTAALAAVGSLSAAADGYILYAGYSFSLNNRQATIHSYEGSGELYIPATIWGYTVVGIEDFAFYGRDDFDKVELRESTKLTTIGSNAFYGCTGFSRAELPSKVESLGECAFQYCTGLKTADCSAARITAIQKQTFYGCTSLEEAALPANLQTIGDWAFGNCTALAYLEIPRSVTEIADTAFFGDENLTLGVWLDSYAHTFAKENGCAYRLLDPVTFGDANGDGFVNINDVTATQQHLAELEELSDLGAKAADINMDNKLEIEDATTLQMFLAEYVLSYPVGETV